MVSVLYTCTVVRNRYPGTGYSTPGTRGTGTSTRYIRTGTGRTTYSYSILVEYVYPGTLPVEVPVHGRT